MSGALCEPFVNELKIEPRLETHANFSKAMNTFPVIRIQTRISVLNIFEVNTNTFVVLTCNQKLIKLQLYKLLALYIYNSYLTNSL